MKIALDTNAYSDFLRGRPHRVAAVHAATEIWLPVVVVGELRAGFAAGARQETNAANLQRFLNRARVGILAIDEQTTHHYSALYLFLRRKGVTIPTNDLWIASLVVQHDLVLCTSDAHFDHLPQIPRC